MYLRRYPSYAAELIDLSRELSRSLSDAPTVLSEEDEAAIAGAWSKHVEAAPKVQAVDPYAMLSVDQLRQAAATLDVPRQVLTAIRNGQVILDSVPRRFLKDLAAAIYSTLEAVLAGQATLSAVGARSYKAEGKPEVRPPVTFEQVLIDAGVPENKRTRLLSETE